MFPRERAYNVPYRIYRGQDVNLIEKPIEKAGPCLCYWIYSSDYNSHLSTRSACLLDFVLYTLSLFSKTKYMQ